MPHHIELTCAEFMRDVKELFSQHSIPTSVRLTDKEPGTFGGEAEGSSPASYRWFFVNNRLRSRALDREELPGELLSVERETIKDCRTREAAFAFLSDICVRYGRTIAGLD